MRSPEQDNGVDGLGNSLMMEKCMLSSVLFVLIPAFIVDHM